LRALWLFVPKIWSNMWILRPKRYMAAILNFLSTFRGTQNMQLVNTLPLMLIWGLCDFPFQRYGQICVFYDEKWPMATILEIAFRPPKIGFLVWVRSFIPPDMRAKYWYLFELSHLCEEKRHLAAILKMLSKFLDSQNLHCVHTLLLTLI
jgi:hypothetical protein